MTQHVRCPVGEEHRRMVRRPAHEQSAAHLGDLVLYHWSPASRRKQIERLGLVPGKLSVRREWRPPYVAFADDVMLAWSLSGAMHPDILGWDLWQVYPHVLDGWEVILDTYAESGRHFIKEYRVYHRIFKRHVEWVATRPPL